MANNKKNEKKSVKLTATAVKSIIAGLEWSLKENGLKAVEQLFQDVNGAVDALVSKISKLNDDATVKASFALDGMTMYALGFGFYSEQSLALGHALTANLKKAKDDIARGVIIKCLQQLRCEECIPLLGKYLLEEEPVFSYALDALRTINNDLSFDTIHEVYLKSEGRKRSLLCAAFLETDVISDELIDEALDCLLDEEDPALTRLLIAKLFARGCTDLADKLLEMLKGTSKVDAAQARRSLYTLIMNKEEFYNLCDDDDDCCDDDCDCCDDDCDCCDDDCDCCDDDCDCCDDDCDCCDDDCDCCDDDCDCCDDDCDCCDDDCDCCDDDEEDAREAELKLLAERYLEQEVSPASVITYVTTHVHEEDITDRLLKLASTCDRKTRLEALGLLSLFCMHTSGVERMVEYAAKAKDEVKADMLRMLGSIGNVAARCFIMASLRSKSPVVRQGALDAAKSMKECRSFVEKTGAFIAARMENGD